MVCGLGEGERQAGWPRSWVPGIQGHVLAHGGNVQRIVTSWNKPNLPVGSGGFTEYCTDPAPRTFPPGGARSLLWEGSFVDCTEIGPLFSCSSQILLIGIIQTDVKCFSKMETNSCAFFLFVWFRLQAGLSWCGCTEAAAGAGGQGRTERERRTPAAFSNPRLWSPQSLGVSVGRGPGSPLRLGRALGPGAPWVLTWGGPWQSPQRARGGGVSRSCSACGDLSLPQRRSGAWPFWAAPWLLPGFGGDTRRRWQGKHEPRTCCQAPVVGRGTCEQLGRPPRPPGQSWACPGLPFPAAPELTALHMCTDMNSTQKF